ncbi:hypothetical protein DPMN_097044 [Dreissena polymorpha]|uniref:Uncharacterized protein n=1 Tax=Dreissena polymorpha TaxID=45954 RepID=A0A9D4LCI5_DREPO|nr:hypothetical protein DPMN_097044 [Dreissena polymorpha]
MFTETGKLGIGKPNSGLKTQLQVDVYDWHIESLIICSVIYVSAILFDIQCSLGGKIHDSFDNLYKTSTNLDKYDVYLVFYRYIEFSAKSVAWSDRQSNVSRVYTLTGDMASPPHNVILGATENKR